MISGLWIVNSYRCTARKKSLPKLTLTSVWHLAAHCGWDGRVCPATTSKRTMLRDMLNGLPPRALLVGDAGFVDYELCADLIRCNIGFLLRAGGNIELCRKPGTSR